MPGGGQSDIWQTLSCRGKYAGEVRVEITYYDSRPKPEKLAVRQRQQTPVEQDTGSVRSRTTPMKRRPLPSDPVTGEAPSPPVATPSVVSDHQSTPPSRHTKSASHAGFIPDRSPLQSVELQTPPHGGRHPAEHYTPSQHSGHRYGHRSVDSQGTPSRPFDDYGYGHHELSAHREAYSEPPELPDYAGRSRSFDYDDSTPPPPPVHRSRHNSPSQEALGRTSREVSPVKATPMPMRKDVLKSEAHRNSPAAYPGQPGYKPYDPSASSPIPISPNHASPYGSPSRHQSYGQGYDYGHGTVLPSVEDVPDSPSYRHGGMSRSPGASPGRYVSPSPGYMSSTPREDAGFPSSVSPVSAQDYSNTSSQVSFNSQASQGQRRTYDASHGPPALPHSLSHSVDPMLSQDISDHIQEERRYDGRLAARGRHQSEGPDIYRNSARTHAPGPVATYSSRTEAQPRGHHYSTSANASPLHHIPRKSVSPAPPPVEERRLSDIPFGPDSYDALNPAMGSPMTPGKAATREPVDPNAKIIAHDGREIDPSDHLPMESWAPEPEPRHGQKQSPERGGRPSLSGAQPMPPSGKRPPRQSTRPEPILTQQTPPSYSFGDQQPRTPETSGRNRLQKKPRGGHSPSASSPLAPISPDNHQGRQGQYTPTRGPRHGSSWDYPNENYSPHHSAPPIPAKIPLAMMSGANGSLEDELQRIDIGDGRSRRRGGY